MVWGAVGFIACAFPRARGIGSTFVGASFASIAFFRPFDRAVAHAEAARLAREPDSSYYDQHSVRTLLARASDLDWKVVAAKGRATWSDDFVSRFGGLSK